MSDYSDRWNTSNTTGVKSEKRYIVKVYSNTGYAISTWDNVISTALNSDRMIYMKLDNGKTVTVVGGIIIVEEHSGEGGA